MEQEHDDLEDARLSGLLHRWGRQTRTGRQGPLFERPDRLPGLEDAMARVDRERVSRLQRRRAVLASAVALALAAAGIWLLVDSPRARPPSIADLRASRHEGVLRAQEAPRFRSGERVYLHFRASRGGWAFVAMLDSAGDFVPVGSDVRNVAAGDNVLGPFRLDDRPGTESFVVALTAGRRSKAELEGWIASARRVAAEVPSREAKLIAALEALRRTGESAAEAVTFEHEGE